MTEDFEKKVLRGLNLCGIEIEKINQKNPLGAAVSGGADSVSLLISLSKILEESGKKNCLEVVTVNHKIRPKNQTDGDAAFVLELCEKLGVNCAKITFEEGEVAQNAIRRKKGTEEAAREMRYNAFENFIQKKNLLALCLAHNQNDQTETVLMRLLSGSGSEGLGGIPRTRGKIARPLLEIPRDEIENYLRNQKISWRTDSTNFDNHYARNKIRNVLVPFLNENFPGWKNSVVLSARKLSDDNFLIQNEANEVLKNHLEIASHSERSEESAKIDFDEFSKLENALKRRVIFSVLNRLGFGGRFPFKLVEEICGWKDGNHKVTFEEVNIYIEEKKLKFEIAEENQKKNAVSLGYNFVFTDENDSFEIETDFGKLEFFVEKHGGKTFLCVKNASGARQAEAEVSFPFFVGSATAGEKIKAADGNDKKIVDIFSGWKVPEDKKNLIPIVRKISGGIEARAVLGSVLGFPDWKVKYADNSFILLEKSVKIKEGF